MDFSVSFGNKLPITKFQVQNIKTGSFEKATLFEMNCNSVKDIFDMENTKGHFSFKEQIINNMWKKIHKHKQFNDVNFYKAETEQGKTIGICETYKGPYYKDITYISSEKSRNYKYQGQAMLASVGQTILKDTKLLNMVVTTPLNTAMKFYKEICGFDEITVGKGNLLLQMDRSKIIEFIKAVEKRTQSGIINLTEQ